MTSLTHANVRHGLIFLGTGVTGLCAQPDAILLHRSTLYVHTSPLTFEFRISLLVPLLCQVTVNWNSVNIQESHYELVSLPRGEPSVSLLLLRIHLRVLTAPIHLGYHQIPGRRSKCARMPLLYFLFLLPLGLLAALMVSLLFQIGCRIQFAPIFECLRNAKKKKEKRKKKRKKNTDSANEPPLLQDIPTARY